MIGEIIQLVEVFDNAGDPILDLCVKKHLSPEALYMPNEFVPPRAGQKGAVVRREIAELIGGPGYSSVRVSTSIEVTCEQTPEAINITAKNVLAECVILNEEGVLDAYGGLLQHRKTLGLQE